MRALLAARAGCCGFLGTRSRGADLDLNSGSLSMTGNGVGRLEFARTTEIADESVFGAGSGDDDIIRYHMEVQMTDVLIRDIPDDVIAALDAHAARLGLSRSEYVRRRLAQDAATPGSPVSVNDLARFASTFADLADLDVMSRAWT